MPDAKKIFELRKAGEIEEAHTLAIQEFAEFPNDAWIVRAYAWVLYDKLKDAIHKDDDASIASLLGELEQLPIDASDEVLVKSLHWVKEHSKPHVRKWEKAKQFEKEGHLGEALEVFRVIKGSFTETDIHFQDSYGWCLYKYIKQLSENPAVNLSICRNLLYEYLELHNEKPSNLHSRILWLAEKLSSNTGFPFYDIFRKWGAANFQDTDWEKHEYEGKSYPGLAEKTIQGISKYLLQNGVDEEINEFQPYLDKALSVIDDNIWLYYYKAKLLLKTSDFEAAEQFLTPVIKQKKNEYWVWALLGDIYTHRDHSKAISCYCKALLCPADEKYLVKTRVTFGKLLEKAGFVNEAKTEIEQSISTRKKEGTPIPHDLIEIGKSDWYLKATVLANNHSFYIANKSQAEDILFADLPWSKGNVGETFTRHDDPHTKCVKILLEYDGGICDFTVKEKQFPVLKKLHPGAGLQAKLERQDWKVKFYIIEPRMADNSWDCLPGYTGIIDSINEIKGIMHFIVDKKINGLIRTNDKSYQTGDFVHLRLMKIEKDGKVFYDVKFFGKTDVLPDANICKSFEGVFSIKAGSAFGFVGDIFVEPALVRKYDLSTKNWEPVAGFAVVSFNESKGVWGWKAVKLEN
jgi:tetratricopeptide (TPR) repeat protein